MYVEAHSDLYTFNWPQDGAILLNEWSGGLNLRQGLIYKTEQWRPLNTNHTQFSICLKCLYILDLEADCVVRVNI